MADETSKFRLDLDNEDFLKKANEAAEAVVKIGESSESISGLVKGLGEVGVILAALVVVGKAFSEAFELILDAEKIEQTNIQFQALANNAGLFSEELIEGLKKASDGWVDENTLMQAANKTLVEFQTGFKQIPELMELARRTSMVMGGDIVSNFNAISQAVASGNARQLRHLGLIVDQNKAYRDYADSIGVTVDTLNQAGKQQAILNAALEEGKKKFSGNQQDVRGVTNEWNKFKTTMTEIKELFVLVFDHTFAPLIQKALHYTNQFASFWGKIFKMDVELLGFQKKHIEEVGQAKDDALTVDLERQKKQQAEFMKIQQQTDQQILAEEIKKADTAEKADQLYHQKLIEQGNAIDVQMAELRAKRAEDLITQEQFGEEEIRLSKLKKMKMESDELELDRMRTQALQRHLALAKTVNAQIAASAHASAMKSSTDWKNAGGLGGKAMSSFQSSTITAFRNIGSGAQSVSDAMKSMFIGMIGEVAAKQGEMMFLSSFETWPIWPTPKTAGGLALIALGGALGAAGGGGASISGGGGETGGAGGGGGAGGAGASAPSSQASTASPGKAVTIQIAGHMLMNDQSQRWLVDQIRAASDSTDFKIQSIGGGL